MRYLDHWTGKSETSARRVHFYYDGTDLMAIRLDNWKMHIGIKPEGSWWDEKYYPSVPYIFNLRMDPMEKMDPQSHEWGYIGRKFLGSKSWVTTAAGPFIAAHIKSLTDFPPSQGTDTLSLRNACSRCFISLSTAADTWSSVTRRLSVHRRICSNSLIGTTRFIAEEKESPDRS